MILTYQTKISSNNFLTEFSLLYNKIMRKLYKDFSISKLDQNKLKQTYQIKFQINSRHFNSIFTSLKNKISISKTQYELNKDKLKDKISKNTKELEKLESVKKKTNKTYYKIHFKKRLINKLNHKLNKPFKFSFGKTYDKRNLMFDLIGSSDESNGNTNCQFINNSLKIRVPKCLESKYEKYQILNLNFNRFPGSNSSKSYKFKFKDNHWFIYLQTEFKKPLLISNIKNGVLGIDLNLNSIGLSLIKTDGNFKFTKNLYFNTTDKRSNQRKAIYGDLVKQIVDIAIDNKCLICIEDLNFLKRSNNFNNRSVNSFEYSIFKKLIESRSYRYGIELVKVNPAYSSIIGIIKYMKCYGLNSATSAAGVIARRYFKMSENIPSHLTPLITEDIKGHVWKSWSVLANRVRSLKIKRHDFFSDPNRILEDYSLIDEF